MTRTDHLLWILAEECMEVAQRISKAARFGLYEIQPGQLLSNEQRIVYEYHDLQAVLEMLVADGRLPSILEKNYPDVWARSVKAKKEKIEKFLKYSKECGTLE